VKEHLYNLVIEEKLAANDKDGAMIAVKEFLVRGEQ
jgi:hypothetical protein